MIDDNVDVVFELICFSAQLKKMTKIPQLPAENKNPYFRPTIDVAFDVCLTMLSLSSSLSPALKYLNNDIP